MLTPTASHTPTTTSRTPARRHLTRTALPVTMGLVAALLTAIPADAAPCRKLPGGKFDCSVGSGGGSGGGSGSGNGNNGGGGGEIPTLPTDDQGLGLGGGDGAQPPPEPDTGMLAEWARTLTALPRPVVHTSPDKKTYVRMRTGLWVDNFVTVHSEPVRAGTQVVQATATPKSVEWQLGETSLKCDDGGSKDGRSCGYTYKRSSAGQPGGAYQITAKIIWEVTWTCDGAGCESSTGTLEDLSMDSAATPLVVSEIQANTRQ